MAGQLWAVNARGGFMSSKNLSEIMRTAVQPICRFRQFADVHDAVEKGCKNKGDTFHWNIYSDVATQGGQLVETTTMPETNITISQGTLTVHEYGNSVPYSESLDNLSEHPVKQIIKKNLIHDAKKAFDYAAHFQFNRTPIRVVPAGGTHASAISMTTNGTATLTNSAALSSSHIKTIVDVMKERNIPGYQGGDYFVIARPATFRPLKNNLEALHQYVEAGFGMIMKGEIGRYEGCRFIEQTNIQATAWTNGLSNEAFFFGDDTVAEGVVTPEEIRGKIPGDYGRSRGVAWYYLGGFGICHTEASQARIFKWDSAA